MRKSDNHFTFNPGPPLGLTVSVHLVLAGNLGDASIPPAFSPFIPINFTSKISRQSVCLPASCPSHGGCYEIYWKFSSLVSSSALCASRMPICPRHSSVWKLSGPSCCFWDESVTFLWPTGSHSGRALPTPQPSTESCAPATLVFFLFLGWAKLPLSATLFFPKLPAFSLYPSDFTPGQHHFIRKSLLGLQGSFFAHTYQKMSQSFRAHICL